MAAGGHGQKKSSDERKRIPALLLVDECTGLCAEIRTAGRGRADNRTPLAQRPTPFSVFVLEINGLSDHWASMQIGIDIAFFDRDG